MHNIDNLLIESDINSCETKLKDLMTTFTAVLKEGVTDVDMSDLSAAFDEAAKRLDAAKRGLGLVNKLPPGDQRTENRRRIMANLNRLRALIARITKEADAGGFSANQQLAMAGNQNRIGNSTAPNAAPPHQPLRNPLARN